MEKQQRKPAKVKTRTGVVTRRQRDKTITVQMDRLVLEPRFEKYIRRSKKLLVHDEKNECQEGDFVQIRETRPLSRRKSWRLVAILKKGVGTGLELKEGVETEDTGIPPAKRHEEEEGIENPQ